MKKKGGKKQLPIMGFDRAAKKIALFDQVLKHQTVLSREISDEELAQNGGRHPLYHPCTATAYLYLHENHKKSRILWDLVD